MRTEFGDASRRRTGRAPRLLGLVVAFALGSASPATAQAWAGCDSPFVIGDAFAVCDGARAVESIRDGLGVGHSGAAPIPGTASALGRRFGATPRFAVTGRVGLVRFDRHDPDAWGSGRPSSGWSPVFGLGAGVGLFDGFSPAPTVGGLLALDLLADVSTVRLPSDDGFDDASVAWGYGVRVGLLRESFTLPGASLSLMRRSGASFSVSGDRGSIDADVTTTSVRATVGKELLGFGVHGGAGWDRVSAEGDLRGTPAAGPATLLEFDDVTDTRFVVFGGVARTFLVTSLGVDAGWTDGVAFGSLSIRLTL